MTIPQGSSCQSCGGAVVDGALTCPHCGQTTQAAVNAQLKVCPHCGTQGIRERVVLRTQDVVIGVLLMFFCFPIGLGYFLGIRKERKVSVCSWCNRRV